jgi:hypothetical protein
MPSPTLPVDAPSSTGRPFTIASYVLTALSIFAPAVLACAGIALGLAGAARGDDGGRTAAVVAGVVLVLEVAIFVLWSFGVIRLPL